MGILPIGANKTQNWIEDKDSKLKVGMSRQASDRTVDYQECFRILKKLSLRLGFLSRKLIESFSVVKQYRVEYEQGSKNKYHSLLLFISQK